jgi:hypothetical protein
LKQPPKKINQLQSNPLLGLMKLSTLWKQNLQQINNSQAKILIRSQTINKQRARLKILSIHQNPQKIKYLNKMNRMIFKLKISLKKEQTPNKNNNKKKNNKDLKRSKT